MRFGARCSDREPTYLSSVLMYFYSDSSCNGINLLHQCLYMYLLHHTFVHAKTSLGQPTQPASVSDETPDAG